MFRCEEFGKECNSKDNMEDHMMKTHTIYPEVDDTELDEWIAKAVECNKLKKMNIGVG